MNTVELKEKNATATIAINDLLVFCNSPKGAQRVLAALQVEFPTRVFHLRDCDITCDKTNETGKNSDAWVHRRALELAVDHKAMWACS
jgi:hypothetical protein